MGLIELAEKVFEIGASSPEELAAALEESGMTITVEMGADPLAGAPLDSAMVGEETEVPPASFDDARGAAIDKVLEGV